MSIKFNMFIMLICLVTIVYGSDVPLLGGSCDYKAYKGHAVITSITLNEKNRKKSLQEYVVKFSFIPVSTITEKFAQPEGKEFVFLVDNSRYPTRKCLEKNAIQVGKILDCTLRVIVGGTCTPILFEFPGIKSDHCLEN
jgi:hypothetical protein